MGMGAPITGPGAWVFVVVIYGPWLFTGMVVIAVVAGMIDGALRPARARWTHALVGLATAVVLVAVAAVGFLGWLAIQEQGERVRAFGPPTGGVLVPSTVPDGTSWRDLGVDAVTVSDGGKVVTLHASHLPVAAPGRPCRVELSPYATLMESSDEIDLDQSAQTHGAPGSMGGCLWGSGTITAVLPNQVVGGRDVVVEKDVNPPLRFRQLPTGAYVLCGPAQCEQPVQLPPTTTLP
jgi:hypothetical protein